MLNTAARYPSNTTPPDSSFPLGSARNSTAPGAKNGYPFDKDNINDLLAFLQGLVSRTGITVSGSVDTVLVSDALDALGLLTGITHATVATAKADLTLKPGMLIRTKNNNSTALGGGANYLVKTAAQATTDGDVIDGFGNHAIISGDKLIIQNNLVVNMSQWGARAGIDSAPNIRAARDFLTARGGKIWLPQLASTDVYQWDSLDTNGTDVVTINTANISIVGESFGAEIDCGIACDNMIGLEAGFLNFEAENLFMRGSNDGGSTVFAKHAIQTFEDTGESSRIWLKRIGGEFFEGHGIDVWTVDTTMDQVKMSFCQDGTNTAYGISLRGQLVSNVPSTATVLTDCGSFDCDNGMLIDKATYITLNSCNNEKCEVAFDIQRADTIVLNACGAEEVAQVANFGDTADANKKVDNLIVNGIFIFDIVNRKSTGMPADRLFSFNRTIGNVAGIEMESSQAGFVNKTPISVDTNSNVKFTDDSVTRKQVISFGTGQAKFVTPEDYNISTGLEEIIFLGDGGDDDLNGDSSAGTPYATFDRVRQVLPLVMNQKFTLKIVGTFTGDLEFRNIKASLGQDTGLPVFQIIGNTGILTDTVTGAVIFGGCTGGESGNGIQVDDLTIGNSVIGSSSGVKIKTVAHTSATTACSIKFSQVVIDGMSVTGTPTTAINVLDASNVKVRNTTGTVGTNRISSQASSVYKSGTEFAGGADATSQAGQIFV